MANSVDLAYKIISGAKKSNRKILTEVESKNLIRCFNIPTNEYILVNSKEDIHEALRRIGFPVAIKVVSPSVIHKSDLGLVKIRLNNEESVIEAYEEMKSIVEELGITDVHGFSIQRYVDGLELIAGCTNDEQFGPIVMVGIGGIFVEVYKDVCFRLAPLSERDAEEMLQSLRGYTILTGLRSRYKPSLNDVKQILLGLSDLILSIPDIKEVDINPLIASKDLVVAVDARIILR
jgi:acetate---CoA ligase (ADP-forming) subunit beta